MLEELARCRRNARHVDEVVAIDADERGAVECRHEDAADEDGVSGIVRQARSGR